MDLKIDRSTINEVNYFEELHDVIVGNIKIVNNDDLEFETYNDFSTKIPGEYIISSNFGGKNLEFLNIYVYNISNGIINGEIKDFSFLQTDLKFQLIDIYLKNSVLIIKGDIIDDTMHLNRQNILIEFCFDNDNLWLKLIKN